VTVQQQDVIAAIRQAALEGTAAGQLPAFLAAVEHVRVEAVLASAGPREVPAAPRTSGRVLTVGTGMFRQGRSGRPCPKYGAEEDREGCPRLSERG
jgi:hypothetical protein